VVILEVQGVDVKPTITLFNMLITVQSESDTPVNQTVRQQIKTGWIPKNWAIAFSSSEIRT
jgi:hypothetical protein